MPRRRGKKKGERAGPAETPDLPRPLRVLTSWADGLARTRWALPAALVLLTSALYARSIPLPLVYWDDNVYLLEDPRLAKPSLGNLWSILTKSYFSNYHPVTTLTYAFDRAIWGEWLAGFRITQLAFYAGGVVLLYYLFRAILQREWAAFAGAAIYLAHTTHVESVAWLAQRKDVVCLVFYAASILAYLRYARHDRRPLGFYALSVALAAAAMLSKGYAVVLPGVLLAYDACFGQRVRRRQLLDKLPFLVLAVITAVLTVAAQDKGGALVRSDITWWQRFGLLSQVFAGYVGRSILPVCLSAKYAVGPSLLNSYLAVLGLLLDGGAVVGFFALRRKLPAAAFGIALFVLPLGTVMNTFFTLRTWMTDRYLFFPTIGSALFLAAGGLWLYRNTSISQDVRRWAIRAAATGLIALYSALTVARIGVWTSGVALWSDVLRRQLGLGGSGALTATEIGRRGRIEVSPELVFSLAKAYEREGADEEAERLLGALRLQPGGDRNAAQIEFARRAIKAGRCDEAIRRLEPIVKEGKWFAPSACVWTGAAHEEKGELDKARAAHHKAIELYRASGRSSVEALIGLAKVEFKARNFEKAAEWYRRARAEAPSDPRATYFLGRSLEEVGQVREALELYEKTLGLEAGRRPEIQFDFAECHMRMGITSEKLGYLERAIGHLEEVLSRVPDHPQRPDILLKMGLLEEKLGRSREAVGHFEDCLRLVPNHPQRERIRAKVRSLRRQSPAPQPANQREH